MDICKYKCYYTYVTLVCGKSVVMRNCNNFSCLLWNHTFAKKTAAWPPLHCQPFPSSTPATQKEVRLSTMGDTRQKINQVGLTCSPCMLKTRKAQFLFFLTFCPWSGVFWPMPSFVRPGSQRIGNAACVEYVLSPRSTVVLGQKGPVNPSVG